MSLSAVGVKQLTTASTCDLAAIGRSSLSYLISEQPAIATNVARLLSANVDRTYEAMWDARDDEC